MEAMKFNNQVYRPYFFQLLSHADCHVDLRDMTSGWPTFTVSGELSHGIVLETIKRGEEDESNGKTSVILRLYESAGGRAKGVLKL